MFCLDKFGKLKCSNVNFNLKVEFYSAKSNFKVITNPICKIKQLLLKSILVTNLGFVAFKLIGKKVKSVF